MRSLTAGETLANLARAPAAAWEQARALRRSPEEQRAWALRRARHIAAHAYRASPFYRAHYDRAGFDPRHARDEDVLRAPPVTKEDLLRAGTDALDARRARRLGSLLRSVSSGTTGAVLVLHHDPRRIVHHGLATKLIFAPFARYRPWHVHAYVYTSPWPVASVLGLYPLVHVPTLTAPGEMARRLAAARPHFLSAYPSHVREILRAASPDQLAAIRSRLRLVSTNSEHSTRAERARFSDALGVPVADEYATEELGHVAAECPEGRYHILTHLAWIEEVDGRLVGTNLQEWTNPIVRYEQGDLGRVRASDCACGWRFPELAQLQGRAHDAFALADGRVLEPGFLLDACYAVVLAHPDVSAYQLVLRASGEIAFRYAGDAEASDVEVVLRAAFAKRGGAPLAVERVADLSAPANGAKWRPILVEGR